MAKLERCRFVTLLSFVSSLGWMPVLLVGADALIVVTSVLITSLLTCKDKGLSYSSQDGARTHGPFGWRRTPRTSRWLPLSRSFGPPTNRHELLRVAARIFVSSSSCMVIPLVGGVCPQVPWPSRGLLKRPTARSIRSVTDGETQTAVLTRPRARAATRSARLVATTSRIGGDGSAHFRLHQRVRVA